MTKPEAIATIDDRIESRYAWLRLASALVIMTVGGAGMYAVVVVLPAIQAEFGVARSGASLPYTLVMIGFGLGGIVMGRLADRHGVVVPVFIAAFGLAAGFAAAASARSLWQFALAHGLLIGMLGCSATFAPLLADISHWFTRRRGIAVAICASGNYLAGALWPPIVQHLSSAHGWRTAYFCLAAVSLAVILPLCLLLRVHTPVHGAAGGGTVARASDRPLGLRPGVLQALLCVAGVGCCVAMSMPQVHLVALCADLGFGPARGAQMLSLMLGAGIVSRLASGVIADRIGGLRTLLIGSTLQGIALVLFLPADGLVSLSMVAGLFGLFQGGIVPSYAIVIREYFAPQEAGGRVGTVIMATLIGMALGGWLSGALYDWTGSYTAAFVNGIGWNLLNVSIVCFLLWQAGRPAPACAVDLGTVRSPL